MNFPPQAGRVWLEHKGKQATRKLIDREMNNALDAPGAGAAAYDTDSGSEVHFFKSSIPFFSNS